MNTSPMASRQGLRLLQSGVALLLLTSLFGFAIPYVAAPHLGLAAHKLAGLQSALLMALARLIHHRIVERLASVA